MTTKIATKKTAKRTPRRIPKRSNRRKYYAFCETIENASPAAAAIVLYLLEHSDDYRIEHSEHGGEFGPQDFARQVAAQAKLIADEIVLVQMLKLKELGLTNDFMCR